MAKRLSGQSYILRKWQGQSLNADSLAPPPLSFQLSNRQLGDEGRLISVTSYPISHFSSTKQRKTCEADETSPSFPFILSPTSVPEEPGPASRIGAWQSYISVHLAGVHASLQGKSGSMDMPPEVDPVWKDREGGEG